MRKLVSALLVAAAVVCALWVARPELMPWERVTTGVDAFEAACLIRERVAADPEDNTFVFHDEELDREELFRALEATWPYAFTLSTTTRRNGTITVEVLVENAAAQRQAEVLAQGLARDLLAPGQTLAERLRVLHDHVVRTCVYDTATAERETLREGSGADAPFTAAGALVDGKAVCAGYARAFMQLCDAAGIDALYISDEGMNHGWNAVRVYDQILFIDTTFDDPVPDRGDKVSTEFFLVDADTFAETHTWDRGFYDPLLGRALPAALGDAQRLYDLGLLPEPPRAAAVGAPMDDATRAALAAHGFRLDDPNETLGSASERVWSTITAPGGARPLLDAGVFDEVRARLVGIPESAVKLHAN